MKDPLSASDYGRDLVIVAQVQFMYRDLAGNFFEIVKLASQKIVYDVNAMAFGE